MKKNIIVCVLLVLVLMGCGSLSAKLTSYKENVEVSEPITVVFSKRMYPNSFTEKTVQLLYDNRTKKMNGHVIYTKNDRKLQFMPTSSLLTSTEYELVISPRVKFENKKDMGEELSFKIITRPAYDWEKTGKPERKEIYLIKQSHDNEVEGQETENIGVVTNAAITTQGAIK